MDKKDFQLLYELDVNARQPHTQLAKKLKLSKNTIAYRIKKLEEKGILDGYRTIIDFATLGFTTHRILLQLVNINDRVIADLISFLRKEEYVWLIGQNEGEWDFAFGFLSQNPVHFYEFSERFAKSFNHIIKNKLFSILVSYHELPRSYLIGQKPISNKHELTIPRVEKIDELDHSILKELSKNARMKIITLAQQLEISSMLLIQRIRKLEKKKIITGYKANLNVMNLNRDYYGVKIQLSEFTEKNKILHKIKSIPEMTSILYTIGGYDIEFDLELQNTTEYHNIINMLRNTFSTIKEIKSMRAIYYEKLSHFPDIKEKRK